MSDTGNRQQTELIALWLGSVDASRDVRTTSSRNSMESPYPSHRSSSTWTSVAASEDSEFRTAYNRQAMGTEYEMVVERQETGNCISKSFVLLETDKLGSVSADTRRTTASSYSRHSVSTSVKSERNRALNKLTGDSISSSRSKSRNPLQRPAADGGGREHNNQPDKHTVQSPKQIDILSQVVEGDAGTLPSYRRDNASLPQLCEKRGIVPCLRGQSYDRKTCRRVLSPASVTRNSAGKLQLERCKHDTHHVDSTTKSHRQDLAKYIVGNY